MHSGSWLARLRWRWGKCLFINIISLFHVATGPGGGIGGRDWGCFSGQVMERGRMRDNDEMHHLWFNKPALCLFDNYKIKQIIAMLKNVKRWFYGSSSCFMLFKWVIWSLPKSRHHTFRWILIHILIFFSSRYAFHPELHLQDVRREVCLFALSLLVRLQQQSTSRDMSSRRVCAGCSCGGSQNYHQPRIN